MASPILRYFSTDHLKSDALKEVSNKFRDLAHDLEDTLPDGPEKTVALRKLLESKDSAVRTAAMDGDL